MKCGWAQKERKSFDSKSCRKERLGYFVGEERIFISFQLWSHTHNIGLNHSGKTLAMVGEKAPMWDWHKRRRSDFVFPNSCLQKQNEDGQSLSLLKNKKLSAKSGKAFPVFLLDLFMPEGKTLYQ